MPTTPSQSPDPAAAPFQPSVSSFLQARVAEKRTMEEGYSAYKKALQIQPDNKELSLKTYNYALALGDIPTAVDLAKTFKMADDPGSIAWVLLGLDAAKKQNFKRALMYLERARSETPELIHFDVMISFIMQHLGRPTDNIVDDLRRQPVIDILKARQLYYIALLQEGTGQTKRALFNLRQSQELEPGALFTVLELGELLERTGDATAAEKIYQTFQDRNPDALQLAHVWERLNAGQKLPSAATRSLEENLSEVMFGFGMLMWAQQVDTPARQLINMAIWLNPNPYYLFYAGMMAEQIESWDQAQAYYDRIPPNGPAGLAAQVQKADALARAGQTDTALAHLQKLKEAHPSLTVLDKIMAEQYYEVGDYAAAIQHYDAVFAALEDPQARRHVPLYFARGTSYERLRQLDKAAADLEAALKLDPDNPSLLNYLGYMWLDADMNVDKAFSYVSKAALLKPGDGAVIDSLGWAYYKKQEYTRALLYLERAAELIPSDPSVVEHLGDVHLKLGDEQKARQYWEQAWDLKPVGDFERARLAKKLGYKISKE